MQQKFFAISEKLYQQANPNGAQGGFNPDDFANAQGGAQPGADNVYEADYREVDNDNN